MNYRAVCRDKHGNVTLDLESPSLQQLLQMVWDELNAAAWPQEAWEFSVEFSFTP